MGFEHRFRISVHAVITNGEGNVLLLKAAYGDLAWGLPGGALDPGETIHDGLHRECREELGCDIEIAYLSGVYSHPTVESHAIIFRAYIAAGTELRLSPEHSAFRYWALDDLTAVQRRRVEECLQFDGTVRSFRF